MAKNNMNLLLIAGVVLAIAFLGGYVQLPTQTSSVTTVSTDNGTIPVTQQITSTTVTMYAVDKYATSTQLTVEKALLKGGVNGTVVSDGDSATENYAMNPADTMTMVMFDDGQTTGIDQSTSLTLDGSNDWYGYYESYTAPLKPTDTVTFQLVKEAGFTTWTEVDGQRNSSSVQWDLSAGEENQTAEVFFKGPSKASFGDPKADGCGLVLVIDANTSLYSDIEVVEGTSVSIPNTYRSVGDWAYKLPYNAIENSEKKTITLNVDVKDGIEPVDATADINAYLMDCALYFDEEGTGLKYGVEDSEDDADIGYAQTLFTLAYVN